MARTPTVSDDEIFDAATKVIRLRGVNAFTLSEVAAETGLSRAAIILRFKSTRALKADILTRMIEEFGERLSQLPKTPSGDHLLAVAAFIGETVGSRESSASFFSSYAANVEDPQLVALEKKRGEMLRQAITRVMPETSLEHESAVALFTAHLTGCIISWLGSETEDPRGFLVQRTREWLRLVGLPFEDRESRAPAVAP
jgi:AcrR family transcriptional regulator